MFSGVPYSQSIPNDFIKAFPELKSLLVPSLEFEPLILTSGGRVEGAVTSLMNTEASLWEGDQSCELQTH